MTRRSNILATIGKTTTVVALTLGLASAPALAQKKTDWTSDKKVDHKVLEVKVPAQSPKYVPQYTPKYDAKAHDKLDVKK